MELPSSLSISTRLAFILSLGFLPHFKKAMASAAWDFDFVCCGARRVNFGIVSSNIQTCISDEVKCFLIILYVTNTIQALISTLPLKNINKLVTIA